MVWWFEVVESRHDLQNPTSEDKILLLGDRLGLGSDSRVLDVGSGRGGPAVLLARAFGCRITCVEQSEAFVAAARERATEAGVESLVELVHADAREFPIEEGRYDAALCLGATFVWGGLAETVSALARGVRGAGYVAVGEPYWRRWPLPEGFEPEEGYDFVSLSETSELFQTGSVELVTLIASSEDDWDRYESLHWFALTEWLRDNPGAPEAGEFRELGRKYRTAYLRWLRDLLGWAIFVGRRG